MRVFHLSKKEGLLPHLTFTDREGVFYIETCQRHLWISQTEIPSDLLPAHIQERKGAEAYDFLLKVICGLESAIIGETDIFGQFKRAWKKLCQEKPSTAKPLEKWILALFEDTKDIRCRFLQGIGGQSYGSLVRKVLNPDPQLKTLILGAGQIAKSIIPYVDGNQLIVANRSQENLDQLKFKIAPDITARTRWISEGNEIEKALKEAHQLILCIPSRPTDEQKRFETWTQNAEKKETVIHLGVPSREETCWKSWPKFFALNDLFQLQEQNQKLRNSKVTQAMAACKERSILRELGPSITVPHGWEDLAIFA